MSTTNEKNNPDQIIPAPEEFSFMSIPIRGMKQRRTIGAFPHLTLEDHVPNGSIPLWIQPVPYGSSENKYFHVHDFTELAIITEGEVDHIVNGETVHLRKGDVICIPPGIPHGYLDCSHMALVNILYDIPRLALPCFDAFDLSKFNIFFPSPQAKESHSPLSPILHLNDNDFQKILGIVNACATEINGSRLGKGLMALFHFVHLIITLSRLAQPDDTARPGVPERISVAIDYVNRHFSENISIEKLAQLSYTSKRNLFRLFKQKTGMNIKAYVQKLRLQKAYTMLLCTNEPVKKIAWQCGFSSDHRFCKVFHDVNNCTPLEFRNHAKKE